MAAQAADFDAIDAAAAAVGARHSFVSVSVGSSRPSAAGARRCPLEAAPGFAWKPHARTWDVTTDVVVLDAAVDDLESVTACGAAAAAASEPGEDEASGGSDAGVSERTAEQRGSLDDHLLRLLGPSGLVGSARRTRRARRAARRRRFPAAKPVSLGFLYPTAHEGADAEVDAPLLVGPHPALPASHPNLVRLLRVQREGDTARLVFEYCAHALSSSLPTQARALLSTVWAPRTAADSLGGGPGVATLGPAAAARVAHVCDDYDHDTLRSARRRFVLFQLLHVLRHLHQAGIAHGHLRHVPCG